MAIKMTQARKNALKTLLPLLEKLEVKLPIELTSRIAWEKSLRINRKERQRLEVFLTKHGKAVVTVDGPQGKFSMMTLKGYENRSANGSKRLKEIHDGRKHQTT